MSTASGYTILGAIAALLSLTGCDISIDGERIPYVQTGPAGETGRIVEAIETLPPDIAILIIEHDMDLVFRLARRITVLVQGSVLAEGPPAQIAADPRVRQVYLGERAPR